MGLLLFKKVFADAIRSGAKTTTLRRWHRPRCKPGQRVYSPGVGYMRVLEVSRVALSSLTVADAHADGFDSLTALRKTLREFYPPGERTRPLWRVRFEYVGPTPDLLTSPPFPTSR